MCNAARCVRARLSVCVGVRACACKVGVEAARLSFAVGARAAENAEIESDRHTHKRARTPHTSARRCNSARLNGGATTIRISQPKTPKE